MNGRRYGRPYRVPDGWRDWTSEQRRAWFEQSKRDGSFDFLDDGKGKPDPRQRYGEHVRRLVKVFCVAEDCGRLVGTVEMHEKGSLWRDPDGDHWSMPPVHPAAVPTCPEHGRLTVGGLETDVDRAVREQRVISHRAKPAGRL